MNDQVFEARIQEIMAKIETLPEAQRGPLMRMVRETRERHDTMRRNFGRLRDALDDWRLIQKYMVFDAEARQREERRGEAE